LSNTRTPFLHNIQVEVDLISSRRLAVGTLSGLESLAWFYPQEDSAALGQGKGGYLYTELGSCFCRQKAVQKKIHSDWWGHLDAEMLINDSIIGLFIHSSHGRAEK
jgi:hypothetical protein